MMMSITLKPYQEDALAVLEQYLTACRTKASPQEAYETLETQAGVHPAGRYKGIYRPLPNMEAVPYVCIRIPTGGGKTLLAAHSIQRIAKTYLKQDLPFVLWLVPSTTIREQTLRALRNPQGAYFDALKQLGGHLNTKIIDIADVYDLTPYDVIGKLVVVVATIQSLRRADTKGLRLYKHHENYEPIFDRFPAVKHADTINLERFAEDTTCKAGVLHFKKGQVYYSFVNLCKLVHPIIVVDEAHNAVTSLSEELHDKLTPACVIEFTATPRERNNVIFSVSANVLKEAEMIKLPILLTEHESHTKAIEGAIAERCDLEQKNQKAEHQLRPIVLFQAQNKDEEWHVDRLLQELTENHNLPRREIAIEYGAVSETSGIDLFSTDCQIRYIITVDKLAEGWDCSWAYVFCSLKKISSETKVEQLLGRVLRMPNAQRQALAHLNYAYTHLYGKTFASTANKLKDILTDQLGYEEESWEELCQRRHPLEVNPDAIQAGEYSPYMPLWDETPPTFTQTVSISQFSGVLAQLEAHKQTTDEAITIVLDETADEAVIELVGEVSPTVQALLKSTCNSPSEKKILQDKFVQFQHQQLAQQSPAMQGKRFTVPKLTWTRQGRFSDLEAEALLFERGWDLKNCPYVVAEHELSATDNSRQFSMDTTIKQGQGTIGIEQITDSYASQLYLERLADTCTRVELIKKLNHQLRMNSIPHPEMGAWIDRCLEHCLTVRKDLTLGLIIRKKDLLVESLKVKLRTYFETKKAEAFQHALFEVPVAESAISCRNVLDFPKRQPRGTLAYQGTYRFKHHFYPTIFDLKEKGEEFECAVLLEKLCVENKLNFWVRNLPLKAESFWLPLPDGRRFYPDFLAQLADGRVLVVEYKGLHLKEESAPKARMGEYWETMSGGKGLFLMAFKQNEGRNLEAQLLAKIATA